MATIIFKETQSALTNCVVHGQSHAANKCHAKHKFAQNWKTAVIVHNPRTEVLLRSSICGGGTHDEALKTSAWESISTREVKETFAVDEELKALRKAIRTGRLEERTSYR